MAEATKHPRVGGIAIHPRVVLVGAAAALVGATVLALFLWMVPQAAARESKAACRGLGGDQPLNGALCPGGQPCALPVAAPDFTALDYQGKPVKLSDFRGKVVLLNFWASWCGVCKTEKPAIKGLAENMTSDDFVVLALASDKNWSDVLIALVDGLAPGAKVPAGERGTVPLAAALEAYKRALPKGVPFQVMLDQPDGDNPIGKIASSWGIKAVPESALIDRNGVIRAYFVNKRDWTTPVAETCLRSVIDE